MAWDPNSSPWDWDTEGAFTTGQVNECTSSVNSHVEISLSGLGVPLHKNRDFGPCTPRADITSSGTEHVERGVGSLTTNTGMPNINEELTFSGGIGHNNVGGRIPVATACSGTGVHKSISDDWGRSGYGNTDFLDPGSLQPNLGPHACHTALSYKYEHLVATAGHVANNTQTTFCPTNMPGVDTMNYKKESSGFPKQTPKKSFEDSANVAKVQVTEEQHSSTATGSVGSADSLTGLHLGKRKYSHDVPLVPEPKGTQKNPSDLRKNRAGSSGSQIPRCQVEGCKVDLTSAKDYHRRHKVCEPHSKAGKVVVASLEQRFCQQCSRFHLLSEFDDAKRSCRRRLAGHNKRRRKPQPDPLGLQARLQATLGDWAFFQQSRFPRMTIWPDSWDIRSGGLWPRTMEFEGPLPYTYVTQVPGMERQVYSNGFSPSISNDKFPLALFQSPKTVMHTDASCSRNHQCFSGSTSGCFSNGLTLVSSSPGAGAFSGIETTSVTPVPLRVADSGRALSLLSLQTNGSQASDIVSLGLSGLTNSTTMNNQVMHDAAVTPQQLMLQGGQQQFRELSLEKLFSPASNSHSNLNADHGLSLDKDLYEYSYVQDSNRHGGCGFESSHPGLSSVHSLALDAGKQTRDLMRTSVHDAPSAGNQGQSIALQLESGSFGDVQSSYGTFF